VVIAIPILRDFSRLAYLVADVFAAQGIVLMPSARTQTYVENQVTDRLRFRAEDRSESKMKLRIGCCAVKRKRPDVSPLDECPAKRFARRVIVGLWAPSA
jgi:hypothetical protein